MSTKQIDEIMESLDNISSLLKLLIWTKTGKTWKQFAICGNCLDWNGYKYNPVKGLCINEDNFTIENRERRKTAKACEYFRLKPTKAIF